MTVCDRPTPENDRSTHHQSHYITLYGGDGAHHVRPVVYGLVDSAAPTLIRYVGRANVPLRRYLSHLWKPGRRAHTACEQWLRALFLCHDRQPTMVLLEDTTADLLVTRERRWINHLRAIGQADLNTKLAQPYFGWLR